MISAITGDSGSTYTNAEVLREDPLDRTFDIFKAESADKSFVFKRVPKPVFDLDQRIATDFPSSRRLRTHVDCNKKERILIYPYFRDTLLTLLQNDPAFPPNERFRIMRNVGEAIQELHAKDWVHNDVKPDNILVDWTCDSEGNKVVSDAVLGDFDIACKLKKGGARITPHAIGNAMWRSPEGQTGMTSGASDIYALGLVYIYVHGAGDLLLINNYQDLVKAGITPEQETVTKHFSFFGPVPESFYAQLQDEKWRSVLRQAASMAESRVEVNPMLKFGFWGKELGEETFQMLSGMMELDPRLRLTIDQILALPFWREE